jgi:hypothetical protein
LHNIVTGFISVKSGHAYGLQFTGNTIDNGHGYLIRSQEMADGWNISGNVVQGICGDFDVMEFKKGMVNCVISNNTFLSDIGYWIGSRKTVNSWINCKGSAISSLISNNAFKNADCYFMQFRNMNGMSVNGNILHDETGNAEFAISITGTCRNTSIVGNAINGGMSLLAKALPNGNAVVGNTPSNE